MNDESLAGRAQADRRLEGRMSAPFSVRQPDLPPPWGGSSRRLSQGEIDRQRELSSRAAERVLANLDKTKRRPSVCNDARGMRKEALRLARRLVDSQLVYRSDYAVWMAVRTSALTVAGARHGLLLQRGRSPHHTARWLEGAQARIEAAFATGGAP